ncbi:hypothetical protein Gogos_004591 [Gossypium gossypioides]|uniref:Uncharacterized protein n=1 Tax=Gossypium gossypioides TaxID=34282 RepID=A0A7J9CGU7_GOSGO|nr:hypothetical protein [Gossypium gossypioides]
MFIQKENKIMQRTMLKAYRHISLKAR